jgi:hypothetical protein
MPLVMLDRWLLWECCFELVNTSVHDLVTPWGEVCIPCVCV